jgi:hypothetical protein
MSTSLLEPPVKTETPDASTKTEVIPVELPQDSPISYELNENSEFEAAAPEPRPRWRRRRYIIDRRFQLKMSLMTGVFVLIPLVAFNVLGFVHGRATLDAVVRVAPELAEGMARQNRFWAMSVLIVSALFFVGVIFLRLLETHRTAGPAYRLALGLEALRDGNFGGDIRLRDGDNLGELCSLVNAVAGSLRERERDEIDRLERLVAGLERGDPAATDALRRLAREKRGLLS